MYLCRSNKRLILSRNNTQVLYYDRIILKRVLLNVATHRPCTSYVYIHIHTQVWGATCLFVIMLPTKMATVLLLALVTIAGLASGRQIHVYNRLGYTVWVGILGNNGKGQPDNGGFALNNGQRVSRGQESRGCGTWSAKGKKLHWGCWKNRVLRGVFGPMRDEVTEGWSKPQKGEIYICIVNGDPVEEGCVANGSVERSAYVFGASKQGQQVLRAQEGLSSDWRTGYCEKCETYHRRQFSRNVAARCHTVPVHIIRCYRMRDCR